MEISFAFPSQIEEQAHVALRFLQLCMQRDPGSAEFAAASAAECTDLRAAYPEREDVFRLSGLVCHFIGNKEAVKRFFAQACLLDADNQQARSYFDMQLGGDPDWPSAEHYLETLRSGEDAVPEAYTTRARRLFDEGEIADADSSVQRALAYRYPAASQSDDIDASRRKSQDVFEAGQLDTVYAGAYDKYQSHWARQKLEGISEIHHTWSAAPQRRQLAALVAELIQQSAADTIDVFEPGCFTGLNLAMIEERLAAPVKQRTRFTGVEPNADAIDFATETYSNFRFVVGSIEDVYSHRLTLPERFDICLISSVFIILDPARVRNVLGFLADRTVRLVICDDIMNVDGDRTVLRHSMNTFIHNYRDLLANAGFKIDSVSLADQPERDRTGFIVATGGG